MRLEWVLAATVLMSVLHFPSNAWAFECPAHFAEAQAIIDEASQNLKRMEGGKPLVVLSHLRHARMSLVEAKYHHAQSGDFHHARSIVRANDARGHALAARILSQTPGNK
jgi:hypothetical protein